MEQRQPLRPRRVLGVGTEPAGGLHPEPRDELTTDFDVLVAGAGPVWLAPAIELGQRSVRCLAVARNDRIGLSPCAKTGSSTWRATARRTWLWAWTGVTPGRYLMMELAGLPFVAPAGAMTSVAMSKRLTELGPKYLPAEFIGLQMLWVGVPPENSFFRTQPEMPGRRLQGLQAALPGRAARAGAARTRRRTVAGAAGQRIGQHVEGRD